MHRCNCNALIIMIIHILCNDANFRITIPLPLTLLPWKVPVPQTSILPYPVYIYKLPTPGITVPHKLAT